MVLETIDSTIWKEEIKLLYSLEEKWKYFYLSL
jgi:hypothetical protein